MQFQSILFDQINADTVKEVTEEPSCFADLYLDQIIEAIDGQVKGFDLKPFFYTPLQDIGTVQYRQEIMQELENESLREKIKSFTEKIVDIRRYLEAIEKIEARYHSKGWFLDAAETYGEAVTTLDRDLNRENLKSRGLIAFREYIHDYVGSESFTSLQKETRELKSELATVRYTVSMKRLRYSMIENGISVTVRKFEDEPDYSKEVEATFRKFSQGAATDYLVAFSEGYEVTPLENRILECVAQLYPKIFTRLDSYFSTYRHFITDTLGTFVREAQFYIAYLEFISPFKQQGLKFCYPQISNTSKDVFSNEGFDLALANKYLADGSKIVCNDFYIQGQERILVVSGPNQGGKTTFARAFGQAHYLSGLGCSVPGSEARLFLFDQLFTHFEKAESAIDPRKKLNDDVYRISEILNRATPNSMVIINEIFSSTTLRDTIFLSSKIVERLLSLDMLGLWVTFVDELASCSDKTVSMVSTVKPENPAIKTFKIIRKPADGLTYALTIAEKYGVTYKAIKERISA